MPIAPNQVGTLSLPRPSARVSAITQYVDYVLVHHADMVQIDESAKLHYRIAYVHYEKFGLNEFEEEELKALYRRQRWTRPEVIQRYDALNNQRTVVLVLYPPVEDPGLLALVEQVKEFVGSRPLKLLTRKHNSRHDSSVAYQKPDLTVNDQAALDLHLSAYATHVVAASSTRPRHVLAPP